MVLIEALDHQKKRFSINFTKFCFSLNHNADNSYLFVNGKKIFKAGNEIVNFSTYSCLESISNGSITAESREVFLNANVYDFSVDYDSIGKSDILNIHKNLRTKNNVK